MRRLLALLLSVAMITSMFTGVASAALIEGEIRLAKSSALLGGDTYGTVSVSGTITTKQGALINKDFAIQVWSNEGTGLSVYTGTAIGGRFSFLLETNKSQPVTYTILAHNAECNISSAPFDLLYGVTLNKSLNFTYNAFAQETVSGTVRYASGSAVVNADVSLHWLNENGNLDGRISPSGLKTNSAGNFGFLINGWNERAGQIALVVGDYIHVVGEVKPIILNVTAKPSSNIVHTIGSTEIELAVSGGPTSGSRSLAVRLYKGTSVQPANLIPLGGDTYGVVATAINSSGAATIKLTSDFSKSTMRAGTYTVVVDATVSGKKLYEGSTTFNVTNPEKFTLLNSHQLDKFSVGDNIVTLGSFIGNMRLVETDANGATVYGQDFVYTVLVNGKETKDTISGQDMVKRSTGTVKVSATGLTNVSVRVIAHRVVGTQHTQVYDRTFAVPVTGWQVTYNVTTLTVDQKANISFVVKDKDGNFVNNAQVLLRHEDSGIADRMQSPLISNINNGTYTFKDVSYNKVGSVQVIVATLDYSSSANHSTQLANVRADFIDGIQVVGAKVYTVTSNVSTLLVGQKQKVVLTVTESGSRLIPDAIDFYIDGIKQDALGFAVKDTNNDGLADAIELEMTASSTKPMLLRARTVNGSKMGEVALSAIAPTLVAVGNTNITANIKSTITFKIVDPRTNTALTNNVQFVQGSYIGTLDIKDVDGRTLHGSVYGESQYTLVVNASDINFKKATEDGKIVELSFKISLDGGTSTEVKGSFPIKNAALASNPPSFIIGTSGNLVFSYQDANGAPLVGYMLEANEIEIGKTNSAGQVPYAVTVGSSSGLKVKAHTDHADAKVEITITATFDNAPPVIAAPTSVDASTGTITITDNVRIARLMVNGVEISIFPLTTIKHIVSLNPGVNTFAVIAMDNNYNVAEKTVTITRTATPVTPPTPPTPPTTSKILTTVINQRGYTIGSGAKVDFAAVEYNANGDTMMPLRMLDALGATATWDEANKTATLTYNGNVVSVAIGGSVAVVNGRAVALVGASGKSAPAYLVPGRTMVPTRFISEQLGFTVEWTPPNNLVITAP